uniref:Uncharacterized protein n=1 Tax=Sphaerodactylus townsendi TaxID=933632 RepID=A0ACB8F6G1_9SAUR
MTQPLRDEESDAKPDNTVDPKATPQEELRVTEPSPSQPEVAQLTSPSLDPSCIIHGGKENLFLGRLQSSLHPPLSDKNRRAPSMMQTDCKNRSFRNLPTWMVYGLLAFWSPPVSSSPTYKWQDPITNYELVCQQCPPGTFVAQHCTQDMPTRCESCPSLYYTQYWNYLDECLYCNTICNSREEEVRPCNATHDRACHCKAGYYFDPVSDFCLPHSTCPLGSGVAQPGMYASYVPFPRSEKISQACEGCEPIKGGLSIYIALLGSSNRFRSVILS